VGASESDCYRQHSHYRQAKNGIKRQCQVKLRQSSHHDQTEKEKYRQAGNESGVDIALRSDIQDRIDRVRL
jgi:Rps23 Pro-64 3,4-dihydroxylase Tpa1-like proline 4-hydroxylase